MDVTKAIETRRAYRSLAPIEITEELIKDLARHSILAPSCFNNQPIRYIFVYEPVILERLKTALSKGNAWAKAASMIVAVFGVEDSDCVLGERIYYLFDIGQATAFLQLRATELGLVAHPIAGFNPEMVKEILKIPHEMMVITLVIIGKKSEILNLELSEKQVISEKKRPDRLSFEEFSFMNTYRE